MITLPNERTVTLKLPRWMVCRVLVMLSAMSKNYLRPAWNEKVHDCIREQLDAHDRKWKEKEK